MYLPKDLHNIIISFVPQSDFIYVCKDWAKEIKSIRKKAVNIIGEWYKSKRAIDNFNNVKDMVRYYVIHYPNDFFLMYPETTVLKLGLTEECITVGVIPKLVNRKRSEVRDWMLNMPIDLEDWSYVGW
jgi:hypothetical protein